MITDTDLDLVPTIQLVEAVARRFEASVFYGLQQPNHNPQQVRGVYKYTGGTILALGLTELMKIQLAEQLEGRPASMDEL